MQGGGAIPPPEERASATRGERNRERHDGEREQRADQPFEHLAIVIQVDDIAEHTRDDNRQYACGNGGPDAPRRATAHAPRPPQRMQPPARRTDYRAEKNQADPAHQRRDSMRFEAEVSLDMAYSERKERLSLGGRIKDGKHVKRLLRNHDVFFLAQLKLRICLEMKRYSNVRICTPESAYSD
jgi:hypothetical protein